MSINIFYRKILIIFLLLIGIFQSFIYAKNEVCFDKNDIVKEDVSFETGFLDLNLVDDSNVVSANKLDGVWHMRADYRGDKDKIMNEILKLRKYNILDFQMQKRENQNSLSVEFIGR